MRRKLRSLLVFAIVTAFLTGMGLPASAASPSGPTQPPFAVDSVKIFGGSGDDELHSVINTPDGGFAAVGSSSSNDGDFTGNHGSYDAVIIRFDKNGNKLWATDIGGSSHDIFNSVINTTDGGFVAVGYTYDSHFTGNYHTDFDAIIAKFGSDGTEQWVKNVGGTFDDVFNSVVQTADGGFITAGYTDSTDGDLPGPINGQHDALIVKFGSDGNMQWAKKIGGSGDDIFQSLTLAADGSFTAAGYSSSNDGDFTGCLNHGNSDAVIVKFDSSGNMLWATDIGGSDDEYFDSLINTADGGFAAVGESSSADGDFTVNRGPFDAIVAKFDFNGNKQWVKSIGGSSSDYFQSIIQTADGGFIAAGFSSSADGDFAGLNKGQDDAIIAKFDAGGDTQWIKNIGGNSEDQFSSLIMTPGRGLVAVGRSSSSDGDLAGLNIQGTSDALFVRLSTIPDAPSNVSVTPGSEQATVSFTAPDITGGNAITGYTVTATPSDGGAVVTATGAHGPVTVTGLRNGVRYSFTVSATNGHYTSSVSVAATATPLAADTGSTPANTSLPSTDHVSTPVNTNSSSTPDKVTNPATGDDSRLDFPILLVLSLFSAAGYIVKHKFKAD